MDAIITLTTDFGTSDAYVAAMKGVILGINPGATLVDICHNIQPQNIHEAAFLLSTACGYFPQGTIHVVVVDPGVGSRQREVILKTPSALFVAPDNGVLSYVIEEASPLPFQPAAEAPPQPRELGPGLKAIALSNPRFWRSPVSSTFHGRDIFAPVAAHLSRGVPLSEFGEVTPSLLAFPIPRPYLDSQGLVVGRILHIDHFGNLVTNVRREDLPVGDICVEVAGKAIRGLASFYAEGDELMAIIGSSGYLEVAAKNRSAAGLLAVEIGDKIRIRQHP